MPIHLSKEAIIYQRSIPISFLICILLVFNLKKKEIPIDEYCHLLVQNHID